MGTGSIDAGAIAICSSAVVGSDQASYPALLSPEVGSSYPSVFEAIEEEGLRSMVKTFGGCFNFRSKRTGNKLSTHCWGIAIDLNPETNQQGITGDMDPGIVEVFRRFGFKWGGDWVGKSKDPMHFQFCTGY
jgi:hypothetical protein